MAMQTMTPTREATTRPGRETWRPPLESGDRLTRAEFERRYAARPDIKKAELVEGVVYVPSPVSLQHAETHGLVMAWLVNYVAATPGVRQADNATLRLDLDNEPQPDGMLWIDAEHGGHVIVTDDGYVDGSPELIVEIAATSASYDLHDKRTAYRRNGVQEYLVLLAREREVVWYALEEGAYRPVTPGDDGVLRSRVFPGLWLQAQTIWENNPAGMLAALQKGLESAEHTAFVAQLARGE